VSASARNHDGFIRLRDVSKIYTRGKQPVRVLDRVELDIAQGSFEAIMGPSGSGKTTLLNLISGIDRATQGTVSVADKDLTSCSEDELAPWRLRHIGFVFQFYHLVDVLTAFQNVELPLLLMGFSKKERARRVDTALGLVGLLDRRDHYPNELSGGQEQRVGIARAIVTDPTIVVADEPTGDLDRDSAESVMALLQTLNREHGKTVIVVTHDPSVARVAKVVRRIDKGRLVTDVAAAADGQAIARVDSSCSAVVSDGRRLEEPSVEGAVEARSAGKIALE
jgi:putative ABC transport system ATP-binding protein